MMPTLTHSAPPTIDTPALQDYGYIVIDTMNQHYHCPISWIAWDDQTNELTGLALIGPPQIVTGTIASILTQGRRQGIQPIAGSLLNPDQWTVPNRLSVSADHWTQTKSPIMVAPKIRWLQTVLLPDSAFPHEGTDRGESFYQIHWNPAESWQTSAWAAIQNLSIPLNAHWQKAFFDHLSPGAYTPQPHFTPSKTWAAPHTPNPTVIRCTGLEYMQDYIAQGLQQHWWTIPEGFGPNPATELTSANPDDYLTAWAPALGNQLDTLIKPRVQAGQPFPPEWDILPRQPFPAQGDVIQALSATLESQSNALCIGEQGTGKTLMMSLIPWDLFVRKQHRSGYRVLVVIPDHLIPKWKREILSSIPHAQAHVITSWQDVLHHAKTWSNAPQTPDYWIIGRDKAKLGYRTHFAAHWSNRRRGWICPDCGSILADPKSEIPWAKPIKKGKTTRHCPACATPLWSADDTIHRTSPMNLLRKITHKPFDCAIFDELHELKGATEQGQVLAWGRTVAAKVLGGTGTLSSGYADDAHLIQYRLDPQSMLKEGIEHNDLTETQQRYGRMQTTIKEGIAESDDEVYGRHASAQRFKKRLPGISPLWFATKLVDKAAFITLEDLGKNALPSYTEEVVWCTMTDEQKQWYDQIMSTIRGFAQAALRQGSQKYLGKLLSMSLTVPDESWRTQKIMIKDLAQFYLAPLTLQESMRFPKETQLIQDIHDELSRNRRVWIYTTFTKEHPQAERLATLLRQEGIPCAVMTNDVPRPKREEWIAQQLSKGIQVMISHPQLVETGLDLYAFPSLFWYSTGYNLFRLRQASRRAWRIGQEVDCLVRFYAYQDSMEETALQLMAQKLEVAMALEGQLTMEGLQRITEGGTNNDLARALAYGLHDVPDVSKIWATAQPHTLLPATVPADSLITAKTSPLKPPIRLTTFKDLAQGSTKVKKAPPENQLAWSF